MLVCVAKPMLFYILVITVIPVINFGMQEGKLLPYYSFIVGTYGIIINLLYRHFNVINNTLLTFTLLCGVCHYLCLHSCQLSASFNYPQMPMRDNVEILKSVL